MRQDAWRLRYLSVYSALYSLFSEGGQLSKDELTLQLYKKHKLLLPREKLNSQISRLVQRKKIIRVAKSTYQRV